MAQERLQKIMAQAGVASRRASEEIIAAGRVTLNGRVVIEQGTKADPLVDEICVDGKPLVQAEKLRYFLLNKPLGYVTTVSDPEGRATVMELMKNCPERVYPVGRLDYNSEGLLLMTNDGSAGANVDEGGQSRRQNVSSKNQRQKPTSEPSPKLQRRRKRWNWKTGEK